MAVERWLGIDFSGNHLKWRPGCTTSNVWIAEVRGDADNLHVHDVRRVQQLPGPGAPFDRLVAVLAGADYLATGIDAPFSVPDSFVRRVGGHAAVLKLVGTAPTVDRPFAKGSEMVQLVAGVVPPLVPPKPMRAADTFWTRSGVNIRSPMWTGARPGAAMTAACLTLLYRAGRPVWPWSHRTSGLLVEAFPAGQLKTWGLPYEKYDGPSAAATETRRTIMDGVRSRIRLGTWAPTLLGSADALDAVICAFAALAASTAQATAPASATIATEGWVAVHP